jgi:RNA polymerase sigma factor (TIGR02999 family)
MNALPGHSMHLHITRLLHEARGGDREALDRLFAAIYDELKVIARARLRRGRDVQSLDTTALVHEAYVRLFEGSSPDVADRAHFYALSSRAMRQVLVDHFRRRNAKKRARPEHPISLLEDRIPVEARGDVLLALDAALERLAQVDARLAQVVEYRFFGGMTEVEIGRVLNLTDRTVRNDWRKARAWLARELRSDSDNDAGRDEPL